MFILFLNAKKSFKEEIIFVTNETNEQTQVIKNIYEYLSNF
jgi:hypothetical protein